MGYDIDICKFIIKNGKAHRRKTKCEIYLSYNWYDLNNICTIHCLEGDGKCPENFKCEKVHLWSFSDDGHARRGDDILLKTQKALDILKKYGITPGAPDLANSNWGWGVRFTNEIDTWFGMRKTENLPPRERLGVFAYHINRFLESAKKYPNCFFIGDHEGTCSLILPDGTTVEQPNEDD